MKGKIIIGICLLVLLVGCDDRYPTPDMDRQEMFCTCQGMKYESTDWKYDVMFCTDWDGSKVHFDLEELEELEEFICNSCRSKDR